MNRPNANILFWIFLAMQSAGSQFIVWAGLPVYQRLHIDRQGASPKELAMALAAVGVMQAAHWLALPLIPQLRLRRNRLLGYALVTLGEFSLFFVTALATFIMFDLFGDLTVSPGKVITLLAMLFAANCHKHILRSVGDRLIDAEPGEASSSRPRAGDANVAH